MKSPSDRSPRDYAILWRQELPIVAVAVVGSILVGALAFLMIPKTFESESRVLLNASGPASVAAAQASDLGGRMRLATYEQLVVSDVVLGRALSAAGGNGIAGVSDIAGLRALISVRPARSEAVVTFVASGPSPSSAQAIAAAVSAQLVQVANELEWSTDDNAPLFYLQVIDSGTLPTDAVSPTLSTTLVTAGVLALLISSVIAVGNGIRRDLVISPRDAMVMVAALSRNRLTQTGRSGDPA